MTKVVDILGKLVAFPSVVGSPNQAITEYVSNFLDDCGAKVAVLPGPEGDRSNVFASFGPVDEPGLILSGHTDVVPADPQDWDFDPFILKADTDRLHGRGTTDMKGFLAAMLMIASKARDSSFRRPLHLALSYDEEAGCRGAPHMIKKIPDLCVLPFGCVVGEPTNLAPVRAHKGKSAVRIRIRGKAGHSSQPDLGLNANTALGEMLRAVDLQADTLRSVRQNVLFRPPYSTVQAGICRGGEALNVIPAYAELEIEARAIPGEDPYELLGPILHQIKDLESRGYEVTTETLARYPGLAFETANPLDEMVYEASGQAFQDAVSFGTEAGLFQSAGIPTLVCGPGNINRAHKPNEYILVSELNECVRFLDALICNLSSPERPPVD